LDTTAFLTDLADTLEVEASDLSNDFVLEQGNWNSLSLVATMALIDEHCDVTVDVLALRKCVTVGDVLRLIE